MMNLKSNKRVYKAVVFLAMSALCLGIFVARYTYFHNEIDETQFHGTYLKHPRAVNQFELTGVDGQTFSNASLKGQWTILFFGFTQCGYLCPTTMAELGKMTRLLEKHQVSVLPRVVMVSVDPERDDLTKLGQYASSFHPSFYGALGDDASVKSFATEMGIAYAKVFNQDGDLKNYDIQHSGALMLFNPQGELNAFFTTPHKAELLAKDYQMLVS